MHLCVCQPIRVHCSYLPPVYATVDFCRNAQKRSEFVTEVINALLRYWGFSDQFALAFDIGDEPTPPFTRGAGRECHGEQTNGLRTADCIAVFNSLRQINETASPNIKGFAATAISKFAGKH